MDRDTQSERRVGRLVAVARITAQVVRERRERRATRVGHIERQRWAVDNVFCKVRQPALIDPMGRRTNVIVVYALLSKLAGLQWAEA